MQIWTGAHRLVYLAAMRRHSRLDQGWVAVNLGSQAAVGVPGSLGHVRVKQG